MYGSRGPALFIILFVFIYFIIRFLNSNKKIKHLKILFPLLIIIILFSEDILIFVNNILNSSGVSSRFLSNLLSGSFFNGNARITLWTQAIDLIKENPLGYGAMGSREALSDIIVAGYPHNVILEILLDFGVIFGFFLISFFVVYTIKILFVDRKNKWTDLYLVYFSTACGLMISLTFWSTSSFWICLAIIISYVFKTNNNGNEIEERVFING